MHSRPGFISKQQIIPEPTPIGELPPTEVIQAAMPLDVLEESIVIPVNRQYIVYGSLEIPDGMDVDIVGTLVVL